MLSINHPENRKIVITFRRQPKALQVASEQTTMENAVPNQNASGNFERVFKIFVYYLSKCLQQLRRNLNLLLKKTVVEMP